MTRVTWSVPRGYPVGDRLDVSSLVGDDVRMTRATADEMTRRAPSPGDGDDRTTSPSVRVIQPSSRVCLDSRTFRALANRMNDRADHRAKTRCPLSRLDPRSSASSASSASSDVDVDADVGSRRRPHRTERDASTRSRSNRPFESSRIVPTPPPFDCRSRPVFFFSRVCDAHRTR